MSMAEPGSCEMNDAEVEGLFLDGSSMSPRRDNVHEAGGAENEVLNEELISSHKMEVQTKSKTLSDSRSTRLQHFMGNAHTLSPICGKSGLTPRPLFRTSSPKVKRKETEDGIVEEYTINAPVVRRNKMLDIRRASSEMDNSLCFTFSASRKRHISQPVRKLMPLQRVKSEDRLSEISKESASSVDTDEEAGGQVPGLKSDSDGEVVGPSAAKRLCLDQNRSELDESISAPLRVPFEKLLVAQDSVLFEDSVHEDTTCSIVPGVEHSTKELARLHRDALEMGLTTPKGSKGEHKEEFSIKRRSSSSRQKENVDVSMSEILGRPPSWDQRPRSKSKQALPFSESGCATSRDHEERVKTAVEKLSDHHGGVISDGTVPYSLPCTFGQKQELMYISCDTLSDLLNGKFDDSIEKYMIIDCRYPYEYNGGHIMGAMNMHNIGSVEDIMSWKPEGNKHVVLIFHCEFSSQRAPNMMRMLRNMDRKHNIDCYPSLCYPEIYLLQGGYKAFYEQCPDLCEPRNYIPMHHSDYSHELKLFKCKATSWHGKEPPGSTHSIIL